jgi:hypothetical protein
MANGTIREMRRFTGSICRPSLPHLMKLKRSTWPGLASRGSVMRRRCILESLVSLPRVAAFFVKRTSSTFSIPIPTSQDLMLISHPTSVMLPTQMSACSGATSISLRESILENRPSHRGKSFAPDHPDDERSLYVRSLTFVPGRETGWAPRRPQPRLA